MSKTIELIFDFVSPNAYLVWQPLKALAEKHGATIKITPAFLGGMHKLTGNAPPFIRDAEVKGKNDYAMLEMNRFIQKHKLSKFRMNPKFPFNTITLQRMLVALEPDRRVALIELLLPPIWEDGLDVTDGDTLGGILQDGGFDAADLLAQTQDPAVKQALIDNTENAVERGAFGIPTIYVDGEMYFGKERLGQIDEQLSA
ncbi:2-hydroxychromene-2-carboxylate isomerase [Sphingorhabdus sp. 109]|jgi:2-hydroxychromene-2-carboxylate isomerase|uniref:2-hydroxychromene-2-carboxylate isomerase n=1 Tax=Sphingorhabdus sp. 109 TaxID=2653173 RepID=UPI0012F18996|nr:2-hydroxychromene-2-carboxylate isomerase [Sphingorhabdus sp. 109]VWX61525.1 2-hydroxychromene-2-carboxylate isomerase [Sphingorhabdus sp. 109]